MNKVKKIEKEIAKRYNGRRCIGSGNQWYMKSDVVLSKFQVEVKSSLKRNQSGLIVKKRWLDKLCKEVSNTGRIPVLCIKTDMFEGYIVKEIHLRLYNEDWRSMNKYSKKIFSKGIYVDDYDLVLNFDRDKWVVLSPDEFEAFVKKVEGKAGGEDKVGGDKSVVGGEMVNMLGDNSDEGDRG